MGFQSTINSAQADGIVGELALEGTLRASPRTLNTTDATLNVIGRALTATADSDTEVRVGGTGAFAGILANPKVYATAGTAAGGALAPTLTLPNYTEVECVEMCAGIYVNLTSTDNDIGNDVHFVQATGALVSVAPGVAPSVGNSVIPGAVVVRRDTTAAGLAIISLTGLINFPAAA